MNTMITTPQFCKAILNAVYMLYLRQSFTQYRSYKARKKLNTPHYH